MKRVSGIRIAMAASITALLASVSSLTFAAPVTIALDGAWLDPGSMRNVHITALASLDAIDSSSSRPAGAYRVGSVHFDFERLGRLTSPFALEADPARTWMFLYPSTPGKRVGELRFTGEMSSTWALPNGTLATDFDLRLYFADLAGDTPGALLSLLSLQSASLWLGTQLGAYSGDFTWGQFSVSSSIPAPGQLSAVIPGLVAAAGLAWRRKRRSLSTSPAKSCLSVAP